MMAVRAVLDANVLAPGFVGEGPVPARLIVPRRAGVFPLVVFEHLLGELVRPFAEPFRRQISPERAARTVEFLRATALVVEWTISATGVATRPKADLILARGLSGNASFLATRDRRLLKLAELRGSESSAPWR